MTRGLFFFAAIAVAGCAGPEQFLSGESRGNPCLYSDDCLSGVCLDLGLSSGVGICTERCSPGDPCTLGVDNGICSSGLCVPADSNPGRELAPCGVVGPATFGPCSGGLVCVSWSDWMPICVRSCTTSASCDGTECIAADDTHHVCSIYR